MELIRQSLPSIAKLPLLVAVQLEQPAAGVAAHRRSSPVALAQPIAVAEPPAAVAEPPAAVSPSPEIRHHRRRIAAPPRRALDVASTAGVLPRRRIAAPRIAAHRRRVAAPPLSPASVTVAASGRCPELISPAD
ncbi:unnamed protein product [Cuscuta campestris]|uniref:Uncharacterized protein n=1 Tax=Cuscuta campestris TaxID=132261 RepID=A0A484M1P1_9ASTE|nr:unnamed protein product [Cuscuta campestris]